MYVFSIEEIEQLRPETTLNGQLAFAMIDWFKCSITSHNGQNTSCYVQSGLRHTDGVTRSPYHYEETFIGPSCVEKARIHFSVWWLNLHKTQKIF